MKPTFTVDGNQIDSFQSFIDWFNLHVLRGQHTWKGNLNAFNDILRGDFGSPQGGFILLWLNSAKSREVLGALFDALTEILRSHGPGGEEEEDGIEVILE